MKGTPKHHKKPGSQLKRVANTGSLWGGNHGNSGKVHSSCEHVRPGGGVHIFMSP